MSGPTPPLRSLLFVPAGDERLLAKAHLRGADALVLDLEDGVPAAAKERARRALPAHLDRLHHEGQHLIVRTGAERPDWVRDLAAAVRPGLRAVMLPKAEHAAGVAEMAEVLDRLERERGLAAGSVAVIPLVETPAALFALPSLTQAPRVGALAFGSEDFAAALGVAPTPAVLTEPCRWIALAAAAHGIDAFALPLSLAVLDRPAAVTEAARRARALGATGSLCVHPAQVAAVNAAYAPDDDEIAWARRVTESWDTGSTAPGVIRVDGLMVDAPVLRRARDILASAGRGADRPPARTDTEGA